MTLPFKTTLLLALLAVPLAAGAEDMPMHGMAHGGTKGPADKAFMKSMAKMNHGMHARPTGDADTDFVTMMLPHHQGAVDMARIELQFGKDPVLRKMAADIVASQEQEIATMTAWQAKNGK